MDFEIRRNSEGIGYVVINDNELFADDLYNLIEFVSKTTDNRQEMAEMFFTATILDNGKSQFFERTFMKFLALLTKNSVHLGAIPQLKEICEDKKNHCEPFKTYLMTDDTGLVKIGKSYNPLKRIKNLQTSNTTIHLIAVSEQNIEDVLHHKFRVYRRQGEWFALSKQNIDHIIEKYNFTRITNE